MKLYISTLGVFDVELDGKSLLKESNRSYKLNRLFQYFLTFRNNKILSDTLIENLWPDNESFDPQNMLRAQIYRLRQMIKSSLPDGVDEKSYASIVFTNGYYCLEVGNKVTLDVDEFENLIKQGDKERTSDINSSIIYYEKALDLYKGTYLEENSYELWLVPMKNYYSSLYAKTLYKLLDILNEQENYHKVIEVCNKAITRETHDGNIHISLMEAMLKLGQIKDAISHYEYTTFLLNKEMDPNTKSSLSDINRKIQNKLIEKGKTNLSNIKLKLEEESDQGPLFCDFDHFKILFNMQKRKRNIEEEPGFITLITLNEDLIEDELKQWEKTMTGILKNSLRTGDAFTFWNEMQILILLQNVQGDGLQIIENRITDKVRTLLMDMNYDINIRSSSIVSETALI
jgi:DNA-binding SARP family transcriptional activator